MAGMLPGVESARRRRFRHGRSADQPSGSRRSPFCMYSTCQETNLSSTSMRSGLNKGSHGGALGNIAREAKERLDERLRTQRALEIMRQSSTGSVRTAESREGGDGLGPVSFGNVQREVFCSKRSFSWSRMGWKASEQAECVVCLNEFKRGDILVHLPCAHRFHWDCVVPWLESSSHCPCCRTTVFFSP